MSKKPNARAFPSSEKRPRAEHNPESFLSRHPAWRLSRMEMCDPYGWHEIDGATLVDIRQKLASFESMTWTEILNAPGSPHHPVEIEALCSAAQKRASQVCPAVEELHSLRLTGKQRVWGIMTQGVLQLLWWDPEHNVCPSKKKHT